MKVYLSGPITGIQNYELIFNVAERALTDKGHVVVNPALLPEGLGDCDTYMGICFSMIDVCDAVVMLPGWKQSFGCCREWGYAMGLDKLICDYETMFPDQSKAEAANDA